ncbi:MAG: ABC transporter substrate-binding protein [Paludibacter sp.]
MKLVIYNILILTTFLFSCNNKSSDAIRIGILEGPSTVSFIQLIDQAPLIDGKKIDFVIKSDPFQIQALMMQDELDFAVLPTVMAANLYNKGIKYRMVACPIWGTLYLLSNTGITDINKLNGQMISLFGQGATSDILIRRMMQQNDIHNFKINYSYTTNNELAQALLLNKIKYAVISEPLVSNIMAKDTSIKIVKKIDCEEYMNNTNKDIFVQTSFLVSNKLIENSPKIIEQVCEAYSNSCNFTLEQPDKTAKLLVKIRISTNLKIAKHSISLCNIHYVGAFAIQQEVSHYLNIFFEYNPKSVGDKMPDNGFIYQTY